MSDVTRMRYDRVRPISYFGDDSERALKIANNINLRHNAPTLTVMVKSGEYYIVRDKDEKQLMRQGYRSFGLQT